MAAYIEFNPVGPVFVPIQRLSLLRLCRGARQGFLPSPPGYQNCSGPVRCHLLEKISRQYRNYLFVHGSTNTKQPAFDLATAQSVVDQQNGELSLPERLRCRIRYFTDGLILGSQSFVNPTSTISNTSWVTNVGALPRA